MMRPQPRSAMPGRHLMGHVEHAGRGWWTITASHWPLSILRNMRVAGDAGVVHQDVDRADLGLELPDHRRAGLVIGDVRLGDATKSKPAAFIFASHSSFWRKFGQAVRHDHESVFGQAWQIAVPRPPMRAGYQRNSLCHLCISYTTKKPCERRRAASRSLPAAIRYMCWPPLIEILAPVTNAASSEDR